MTNEPEIIHAGTSKSFLTFAQFLESSPPGVEEAVSNLARSRATTHGRTWEIATPDIQLHCTSDVCGGTRIFSCNSEPYISESLSFSFLRYDCRNCKKKLSGNDTIRALLVVPRVRGYNTDPMYSAAVLDHSNNPRNMGDLPDVTATVAVTNPVCGDELRVAVRIEEGRVTAAKFRARGCRAAIACSSLLTELMIGKTIAQLREINAEQISTALGCLPPATRHGSQLAEDALDALLDQL